MQRIWSSESHVFLRVREWLYVSKERLVERGSFWLAFKERWPLKDGNSSLSSRTWDRVKSFPPLVRPFRSAAPFPLSPSEHLPASSLCRSARAGSPLRPAFPGGRHKCHSATHFDTFRSSQQVPMRLASRSLTCRFRLAV